MDLKRLSKFMSLILRHHPESANVTLDKNGWCDANALLLGIKNKHPEVTWVDIAEVIFNCPKKRYEILDGKIRAAQGHSVEIDIEYQPVMPTHSLYHGTPRQKYPFNFGHRHQKSLAEDMFTYQ